MSFVMRSKSQAPQELLVDVAVHFVKAADRAAKKVFKLKRVTLPGAARLAFATRISLAVHTTRKPHPGRHAVDIIVNGQTLPAGSFEVLREARDRAAAQPALRNVRLKRARPKSG